MPYRGGLEFAQFLVGLETVILVVVDPGGIVVRCVVAGSDVDGVSHPALERRARSRVVRIGQPARSTGVQVVEGVQLHAIHVIAIRGTRSARWDAGPGGHRAARGAAQQAGACTGEDTCHRGGLLVREHHAT